MRDIHRSDKTLLLSEPDIYFNPVSSLSSEQAVPIKTVESNKTLNIIELYTFFIFAILLNKFITIEDFVISEDSI